MLSQTFGAHTCDKNRAHEFIFNIRQHYLHCYDDMCYVFHCVSYASCAFSLFPLGLVQPLNYAPFRCHLLLLHFLTSIVGTI